MENLGVAPAVMRRRVEEMLDLLGLAELRDRRSARRCRAASSSASPSGRCWPPHPGCSCSTSPRRRSTRRAAEEVLAALPGSSTTSGITVLLAEHRLERVVQYADRWSLLAATPRPGRRRPPIVLADSPGRPAGRRSSAGWPAGTRCRCRCATRAGLAVPLRERLEPRPRAAPPAHPAGAVAVTVRGLPAGYGDRPRSRGRPDAPRRARSWPDGPQRRRQVDAAATLAGASPRSRHGAGRRRRPGRDRGRASWSSQVGFVPQDPALCCTADGRRGVRRRRPEAGVAAGTRRALSPGWWPASARERHPRDLSEGQRLTLALAVVLAAGPPVVLLDEPTRGLDYPGKAPRCVGAARAGRHRPRRRARHPRRRARRRGRRPRRGAGRRRGRRRRARPRGGVPVAGVRPAGREDRGAGPRAG